MSWTEFTHVSIFSRTGAGHRRYVSFTTKGLFTADTKNHLVQRQNKSAMQWNYFFSSSTFKILEVSSLKIVFCCQIPGLPLCVESEEKWGSVCGLFVLAWWGSKMCKRQRLIPDEIHIPFQIVLFSEAQSVSSRFQERWPLTLSWTVNHLLCLNKLVRKSQNKKLTQSYSIIDAKATENFFHISGMKETISSDNHLEGFFKNGDKMLLHVADLSASF